MKVDPSSTVWKVIAEYIDGRTKYLRDQLCGGSVKHEEGTDTQNRARLRELERLVTDLTTDKQND